MLVVYGAYNLYPLGSKIVSSLPPLLTLIISGLKESPLVNDKTIP